MSRHNNVRGPFTEDEVFEQIRSGRIVPQDFMAEDLGKPNPDWQIASHHGAFAASFAQAHRQAEHNPYIPSSTAQAVMPSAPPASVRPRQPTSSSLRSTEVSEPQEHVEIDVEASLFHTVRDRDESIRTPINDGSLVTIDDNASSMSLIPDPRRLWNSWTFRIGFGTAAMVGMMMMIFSSSNTSKFLPKLGTKTPAQESSSTTAPSEPRPHKDYFNTTSPNSDSSVSRGPQLRLPAHLNGPRARGFTPLPEEAPPPMDNNSGMEAGTGEAGMEGGVNGEPRFGDIPRGTPQAPGRFPRTRRPEGLRTGGGDWDSSMPNGGMVGGGEDGAGVPYTDDMVPPMAPSDDFTTDDLAPPPTPDSY